MPAHGYLLPTRGVVFSADGPTTLTARVQADVVGLARRAESLGFSGVWVGDSVLAKPRLDPLTTLAAVATETAAVRLGTAVYLPLLRHPVTVAHMTATLDLLSGGRFAMGVGVGVRPTEREEQEQLGVPFDRRGAMLDESLKLIKQLWTGTSVDFTGEFFNLSTADLGFGPAGHPPVFLASAAFDPADGFPARIRDRLAEHGDGWLPIAVDPESYATGLQHAKTALESSGRDPESLEPAYYQDVVIAETEEAALEQAREFLLNYYPPEELTYLPEGAFDDDQIRRRGVFGPPERVEAHLERYRSAGVETFVTRFPATNQREQLARYSTLMG